MGTAVEDLRKYLRSEKLKLTTQRRIVFEEMLSSRTVHSNAYEIHRGLREKGHRISLATVYRTLNLLVKSGLVSQIDLGEDHSHYEPERTDTGHGHLVCLSCGRVKEFFHPEISRIIARVGREGKFRTDKLSIQVFGYCKTCRKK